MADTISYDENIVPETVSLSRQVFDYKVIGINSLLDEQSQRELEIPPGIHQLTIEQQDVIGGMILALRAYVLTDHLEPYTIKKSRTEVVTYFPTWWDHLKANMHKRWWWPWRKFNVADKKVTMTFEANVFPELVFPDADISYPVKYGRPYKATHYQADISTSRK